MFLVHEVERFVTAPEQPLSYETPAPLASPHIARDVEHLRLLSIFHYIVGGLIMLFSSCFIMHVVMGLVMLFKPAAFNTPPGQAPMPPAFAWMFIAMGGLAVFGGWTIGGLTIYSGRRLALRRNRTLSLIVAGIDCLMVPFGTVLGVFTFIVLLRDSVQLLYDEPRTDRAP